MPLDELDSMQSSRCTECGTRLPPDHGWSDLCDSCEAEEARREEVDSALDARLGPRDPIGGLV